MEIDKATEQDELLHDFKRTDMNTSLLSRNVILLIATAVVLGIGSGYVLSHNSKGTGIVTINTNGGTGSSVTAGATFGSNDTATFKDTAQGTVQEGGIKGEGQFHLVRPGGDSQNVYMTSSTVDLSLLVGHKVKVWGQTQTAKTAGWLMDVGRVEVLE